jgi:hypothetical protein
MALYSIDSSTLTQIADVARAKGGADGTLTPDEMVEALNNIDPTLWGGKMVTGSFTLAQDSTSEYVIARAGDEVLNGLLDDGETFASIYGKLCMLVMRAGTTEFNAANYPGTMGAALRVTTKPYSYHSIRQYWNASGSSNTQGGGTTIDANKIAVTFQSGCAGSAAFTYNWVVWRHIK